MASVKKTHVKSKTSHNSVKMTDQNRRRVFISDLIEGRIQASKYIEVKDSNGKLVRIDYDDPDGGPGVGQGGSGTRGNDDKPLKIKDDQK